MKRVFIFLLKNREAKYNNTNHNIAFASLPNSLKKNIQSFLYLNFIKSENIIFFFTNFYDINDSGFTLQEAIKKFSIQTQEKIVICFDDLSLNINNFKIQTYLSKNILHNGIRSIINCLPNLNQKYKILVIRIGFGVKLLLSNSMNEFVLQPISCSQNLFFIKNLFFSFTL